MAHHIVEPKDRARRAAYILTACLALLIAGLTLLPVSVTTTSIPGTDKTYHMIAWGALVLPVAILAPRSLIAILPLAILFGVLIELVQPYVGRTGDWHDAQADVIGALIGVIIGTGFRLVAMRRYRRV